MNTEGIKRKLASEPQFSIDYKACRNRQTVPGKVAGSSASVQRRSVVSRWANNIGARVDMLDAIELERYFNEHFELCPYGLESKPAKENNVEQTKTTTIAVEKITLVYGRDSRQVSDDQMYGFIADLEAKIKSLQSLQNKPKKLLAQLEMLQKEIDDLVALVDSRI